MTNRRPLPLDVDAYEADTRHLSAEEDGVYSRLLRTMWTAGGTLPKDDERLAQIARISLKRWNRMAVTIMAFFTVVGDHIEQKRISFELAKADALSEMRAAIGRRGGRPPKGSQQKPRAGTQKAEKPSENGHDENQKVFSEEAFAFGLVSDSQPSLFPQESSPPNPPSKNTPISPPVSVGRAKPVSKKTFVLVRDVLETALSHDMAQAVIQHRNITIKKPLTVLAAQQLVAEFRKAEDAGVTADDSARLMIRKGWRGFEAEWAIPRGNTARSPPAAYGSPAPPVEEDEYSEANMLKIAAKMEAKYGRKP